MLSMISGTEPGTYDAARTTIPARPTDDPDRTSLVIYELASGWRYGQWLTEQEAKLTRARWENAWESGGQVGGSIQLGDVSWRSAAVVAIHTSVRRWPGDGNGLEHGQSAGEVRPGMCSSCGAPFAPTHDIHSPGPTVRHPFTPQPVRPGVRSTQ